MARKTEMMWKCRDGREVRVRDMDDRHLLNTLAYLRRRREGIRLSYLAAMGAYAEDAPDGAADATESAMDELMEMDGDEVLEACVPQYRALVRESERRGLCAPQA